MQVPPTGRGKSQIVTGVATHHPKSTTESDKKQPPGDHKNDEIDQKMGGMFHNM